MRSLCIIPARGGSKRFVDKNIAELNGKPLVFHTIDLALSSFEKIIFTSDSKKICDLVYQQYSNTIERTSILSIEKRPPRLAGDKSKVIDTVCYYYDRYHHDNKEFDYIWLMLPTCPLRTQEDVDNVKKMLRAKISDRGYLSKGTESVISVTPYRFPASLALVLNPHGSLKGMNDHKHWIDGNSRSQDHVETFHPNGAIYVSRWDVFGRNRNFYKGAVKPYIMPEERSVDIDEPIDLKKAEFFYE